MSKKLNAALVLFTAFGLSVGGTKLYLDDKYNQPSEDKAQTQKKRGVLPAPKTNTISDYQYPEHIISGEIITCANDPDRLPPCDFN